MAKRGPKPKNPKLLEKEGAYRVHPERKPEVELVVIEGTPEPTQLVLSCDIMVNLWNQTCDLLRSLEIINQTDVYLLESFVVNYAQTITLTNNVMRDGHSVATVAGAKRNPDSQALQQHTDRHLRYLAELGLTPSARARFAAPDSQGGKSDPLMDVLNDLRN